MDKEGRFNKLRDLLWRLVDEKEYVDELMLSIILQKMQDLYPLCTFVRSDEVLLVTRDRSNERDPFPLQLLDRRTCLFIQTPRHPESWWDLVLDQDNVYGLA